MLTLNRSIKVLVVLAAIAVCSLTLKAQDASKTGLQPTDEAVIRENVKLIEEGWNTKNATLFAKPFADDADYVVVTGQHIKGRERIEKGHQPLFETIFKESTISLSVNQIRLLRPDVALVHVSGHNKTKQGEAVREWDLMLTLVMTKDGGKWKIASFHNMMVNQGPPLQRQ